MNSLWPKYMKKFGPVFFQEIWRTKGKSILHSMILERIILRMNIFFNCYRKKGPKPEVKDQHWDAEILLSGGDQMARHHVLAQKRGVEGKVMERVKTNPKWDSRLCQVKFPKKIQKQLSMSLQNDCVQNWDEERNEFLLLDLLVDYKKDRGQYPWQIRKSVSWVYQ